MREQISMFEANTLPLNFDGQTYEPVRDSKRLGRQLSAVLTLMRDGHWRTLYEIREATGEGSEAAISARLRDLRKARFGGYQVNRRRRGLGGTFEYQVA